MEDGSCDRKAVLRCGGGALILDALDGLGDNECRSGVCDIGHFVDERYGREVISNGGVGNSRIGKMYDEEADMV